MRWMTWRRCLSSFPQTPFNQQRMHRGRRLRQLLAGRPRLPSLRALQQVQYCHSAVHSDRSIPMAGPFFRTARMSLEQQVVNIVLES